MKISNVVLAASFVGSIFCVSGCSAFAPYPIGSLYQGTQTPHAMDRAEMTGAAKTGDKMGEACASGIISAIAWGDASIDAAKKAGGITEVHTVDIREFNILGLYTQGCTQVHGK